MKLVLILLFFILAMAVGIFLAPELLNNKHYVLIGLEENIIQMRLNTFIFVCIAGFFTLYILFKLVRLLMQGSLNAINWTTDSQGKRAHKRYQQALLAMAQFNWSQALQLLKKSNKTSHEKLQGLLFTAFCANQINDTQNRDDALLQAELDFPKQYDAINLARIQMLMAQKQWSDAEAALKSLKQTPEAAPNRLKLAKTIYLNTQNYTALEATIKLMKKAKLIGENEWVDLSKLIKQHSFSSCQDITQLQQAWKKLARAEQQHPSMIELYSARMVELGEVQQAEALLKKAIKKTRNQSLLIAYCQLPLSEESGALKFVESQIDIETATQPLCLAIAKLALQCRLWGVAQSYLEKAQLIQPTQQGYWLQAQVHRANKDHDKANGCFEKGLALANN